MQKEDGLSVRIFLHLLILVGAFHINCFGDSMFRVVLWGQYFQVVQLAHFEGNTVHEYANANIN